MTIDQVVSKQIEIKRKILALQSARTSVAQVQEIAKLQAQYITLQLSLTNRKLRTSTLKKAGQKRGRKMKFCPNCKRRMYAYRDTTNCWYCEHDGLVAASPDKGKCEPGQERQFKQCPHCRTKVHTYQHKHKCRKCGRTGLVSVKKSKGKWVPA